MEIVPTSAPLENVTGLDELYRRKASLKNQIREQEVVISTSTKQLLSPTSITSNLLGYFTKGLTMLDGVMIGFKVMKSIKRLFRK